MISAKNEYDTSLLRNFSNKINSFDTWDLLLTPGLYLILSTSMTKGNAMLE